MNPEMKRLVTICGFAGLLIGLGISAYAHSGNGFETGPLVFLGLVVAVVGGLGSALLFIFGKRGQLLTGTGTFSIAMLIALILVPAFWPYPKSPGPVPLDGKPRQSESK